MFFRNETSKCIFKILNRSKNFSLEQIELTYLVGHSWNHVKEKSKYHSLNRNWMYRPKGDIDGESVL